MKATQPSSTDLVKISTGPYFVCRVNCPTALTLSRGTASSPIVRHAVGPDTGQRSAAGGQVQLLGLRLARAGGEVHAGAAAGGRTGLELGEHPAGQAPAAVGGGGPHPLDLG